jgi:protein-L-isoaspartate(D-aspartate) O-methyltransferase
MDTLSFERERRRMVDEQLAARGIVSEAVLEAFRQVPRHAFVDRAYYHVAYADMPLPIAAEQTISQPFIIAYMLQALRLSPDERALEVGAGSGYAAAILSRLVLEVFTVERHPSLVEAARRNLAAIGCENVHVHLGDGTMGWQEHAPYDAIVVAASGPAVPSALREQLAIGGRLLMPVGEQSWDQHLVLLERQAPEKYTSRRLAPVRFVPLIGEEGW